MLSGLPLFSEQTGKVIPNYQIHEDGSVSPHLQSGNAWLGSDLERYDASQLNEIDRQKRDGAITLAP